MIEIKKIDETNKNHIIGQLRKDIVRHVFAIYDIEHDPKHTTAFAAFQNETLQGYMLIYTGADVTSVILESNEDVASELMKFSPQQQFIVHAPPNLLNAIARKFPNEEHYTEDWMIIKRGKAHFSKSNMVRQLRTESDASSLAELLSERKDRPQAELKKYIDWIAKMPVMGVYKGERLVSYAASILELPEIWLIGGVYTAPSERNKGYSTVAVSAITEQALKTAFSAILFVRSDNYPAIRVYEKIGYGKMGQKLWIDIGTGLKP